MKTLFFSIFLIFSLTSNAQITKGHWMVGGNAAFSYSKSKPGSIIDSESFAMDISPNVGYFLFDKIAFGSRVDYFLSSYKTNSENLTSEYLYAAPFVRYYFLEAENAINVFLESSYRFNLLYNNYSSKFGIKGGLAIFLNRNVAFEIALEYLNLAANDVSEGLHFILLSFGIQVHLDGKKS